MRREPGAERMAERLLQTHDVSDLCIGKPALRWLPPCSTVADAVAELDTRGPDAALAVWDGSAEGEVAGRVCMADVLLFLCAEGNLAAPAAALQASLADLLAAGAPPVRRIEPDASVLEAADAFLDGAHTLVVPIRERWRLAPQPTCGGGELCWLTLEDLARFFLSSIALFAPIASRSVSELGVVRPATLAVAAGDNALSAVPLLRNALESHTAVAVVSGEFPCQLVGDISPSTLCCSGGNVSVAAAIAALSAGNLLGFMDWGGAPPDATLHAVRSRLRRRGLHGMLDLVYGGDPSSSSSCCSSSASSSGSPSSGSSSGEEDEDYGRSGGASPCARRGKRQRLRSTRSFGRRRVEETIVCHMGSSLVAVMVQAMAHRATQVWVVEEDQVKRELGGVVGLLDVLRVLRNHLHQPPL